MSDSLEDLELSTAVHMLDLTAISESRSLRNALIPHTFGYLEQFIIQTLRQTLHTPLTLATVSSVITQRFLNTCVACCLCNFFPHIILLFQAPMTLDVTDKLSQLRLLIFSLDRMP